VREIDPELAAEHDALLRQTEALRREHTDLQGRSVDIHEHEAHRARLRTHIDELQAHIAKWRNRASDTDG
jgi:hypothetical protein